MYTLTGTIHGLGNKNVLTPGNRVHLDTLHEVQKVPGGPGSARPEANLAGRQRKRQQMLKKRQT